VHQNAQHIYISDYNINKEIVSNVSVEIVGNRLLNMVLVIVQLMELDHGVTIFIKTPIKDMFKSELRWINH